MDLKLQYKSMVNSLKLLAATYEEQVSYLPDFVEVKDEVTNIFADSFLLIPQLIENGLLSQSAIASIIRCFNFMELALRNNETNNKEAFINHDSWLKVRQLAIKALEVMNEEKGKPDLHYLDWID